MGFLALGTLVGCQQTGETSEGDSTSRKKEEIAQPKIDYKVKLDTVIANLKDKQAKVQFSIQPQDKVTLAVTDIGNVAIHSDTISGNKTEHTLNLKNLRPGIYLVSVIAPGGQRVSKELLWQ